MPDIDLSKIFAYCGNLFVRELRERVLSIREDIAGNSFSPIKPSTARARALILGAGVRGPGRHQGPYFNRNITLRGKLRKSPARSVPITRLLFTGRFGKGAFKSAAYPDRLVVYVSRGNYPVHWTQQALSYADIVRYNNAGSPYVNRRIKNPPLIFPNKGRDDQVERMTAFKKSAAFLSSPAVHRYIQDKIALTALRKVSTTVEV